MNRIFSLTAPIIISSVLMYAGFKGTDVYSAMLRGAKNGLKIMAEILPALLILFPAVYLFRACGLPELLDKFLSPVFEILCIPPQTGILMLIRPFSGSGAMAAAADIISEYGADSLVGRTAAVMLGSSETTFYVIALYFAASGIKRNRWVLPAALLADFTCFLSSAWICRIFWGL